MNVCHIGDDFTSILLLPPLCLCINCPLERAELDLSHPPPPHSYHLSSTDFSADRQCLGGGLGSGGWAAPPPRHKLEGHVSHISHGGGRVRVGGMRAGGKVAPCPHVT
jgi:hypothetical protein